MINMKKTILVLTAIFTALIINAQNIDTVLVRNLQFQAQDWAWLVGKNESSIYRDSASAREFRRIRDRIRTANPPLWTTNVTIDSIPGWVVLSFYKTTKTGNAGEIVSRYTAITSAIESKANMTFLITPYNDNLLNDFNRARDKGKSMVMDN